MEKNKGSKANKTIPSAASSAQNPPSPSVTPQEHPVTVSENLKTAMGETSKAKNPITFSETSSETSQKHPNTMMEGQQNPSVITSLPSFSFQYMFTDGPVKNNPFRGISSEVAGHSKTNPPEILVPVEENPAEEFRHSVISGRSIKNPPIIFGYWKGDARAECEKEKNYSFYLEMKPANKLNFALAVLTDSKMNPKGYGRIDVNRNAVELTVHEPRIFCCLRLNAAGLIKFRCVEPLENKMIVLSSILDELANASDNDVVTIYHVTGSNDLSFKFGSESAQAKAFSVKLYQAIPGYQKFPISEYKCEAVILSEHLREMCSLMTYDIRLPSKVWVQLRRETAAITVGEKQWRYNYDEKHGGTKGLEAGESFNSGFWIHYPHALWKASYLAPAFLFCPVAANPPCKPSLWRFNLQELGDLAYLTVEDPADFKQNKAPSTSMAKMAIM